MQKNAIVFMFDSLQFNYLGCYGNDWIKTPNFDRFAREGVVFDNCYIEGLPTVPCRRAMHTGRYTVPFAGWVPLTMEDTTIADLCWGRPIDTALIFDCPMYRQPKFGYTRGFDKVYFTHGHEGDQAFYKNDPLYSGVSPRDYTEDHLLEDPSKQNVVEPLMREMDCYLRQMQYWRTDGDRYVARTVKHAVRYLEQADRNKQFFLWVDSFDPHEPWNPPSTVDNTPCPYDPDYKGKHQFLPFMGTVEGFFTEDEMRHVRMLYAESVSVCDKWLGVFLDAVRRLGLEENTLMMVVSDHGEPMGNGEHGHGIMRKCRPWPYEELVHGVMLMRGPGIPAGTRSKAFVQSVDVAPTVCDWLGIGVHPSMHGKSLLPVARGEAAKVRDFSIAGYYKYSWALYCDDWSYIHWVTGGDKKGAEDYNAVQVAAVFAKAAKYLEGVGTSASLTEKKHDFSALEVSAYEEQKNAATLDGEDQWTCTPGSLAEVPEADCLFDRRTDPFQLRNVIAEHPDVARELLMKLQDYIAELRAS